MKYMSSIGTSSMGLIQLREKSKLELNSFSTSDADSLESSSR